MNMYMKFALIEAQIAKEKNEIPVGAIIIKDNEIIAKAHNQIQSKKNPTAHAEIMAIQIAAEHLKSANLSGCEMYVTMEPCPMCMGAIINSKMSKVVYGCYDYKFGACGSNINLNTHSYASNIEVIGGIMEKECSKLVTDFFVELRESKKS